MANKKTSFINAELDFAEQELSRWKKYLEDNPMDKLQDRWGKKEMPKGGVAMVVVASVEDQIRAIHATMSKYLELLAVVDNLREKEAVKQLKRGGMDLSPNESGLLDD